MNNSSRAVFTFTIVSCLALALPAQEGPKKKSYEVKKQGTVKLDSMPSKSTGATTVQEMPKQGPAGNGVKKKAFTFEKKATINLGEVTTDYNPALVTRQMPKQGGRIEQYNYPPHEKRASAPAPAAVLPALVKGQSFLANGFSGGTPNDNDMAISDQGIVLSVINSDIYVKNTKTGVVSSPKSLAAISGPLNIPYFKFDPKVMYDPTADRFVMVFLAGNLDTTSSVILGFSQTNNPNLGWNMYKLPGNPLNNGYWTDYPMIAMTGKELFLTVNLLINNSTWQAGFVETLVWQINKTRGYKGQSLSTDLHSNIKFNGKPIRNLCPVKGGSKFYSPDMNFVSNRNLASQNDTVFLVNISDTIGSLTSSVTVKVLKTNTPYHFPLGGRQTNLTQTLQTNDSRNLGAFYENNLIQYVHNTRNPGNNFSSIYYGVISNPQSATPGITGYILPNDSMDYAYPNISYAGAGSTDNTAIITFDHSSDKVFPGCSAVQADGSGNFSSVLKIEDGAAYVNVLTPSNSDDPDNERWGDYSGSQRRYGQSGEVWMSGYHGYSTAGPNLHGAWVAQIFTNDRFQSLREEPKNEPTATVFPNPARDAFTVEFHLPQPEYLSFELFDIKGKSVALLARDWVRVSRPVFSFNTNDLESGVYMLKVSGDKTNIIKKIVVH